MSSRALPNETAELVEHVVAFQGHFRVARYRFRHGLYQGGQSGIIQREVFERGTAPAFVIVATVFLGATMLGWRALAERLTTPG